METVFPVGIPPFLVAQAIETEVGRGSVHPSLQALDLWAFENQFFKYLLDHILGLIAYNSPGPGANQGSKLTIQECKLIWIHVSIYNDVWHGSDGRF